MKVVCIDNTSGNARHLDLWGVYDAVPETVESIGGPPEDFYIIKTKPYLKPHLRQDMSTQEQEIWIDKKAFITIDQFRQIRLKELGID